MSQGHIVTDKWGRILGAHKWEGVEVPDHCPIVAPPEGQTIECSGDSVDTVIELMRGGQILRIQNQNEVTVEGVIIGRVHADRFEIVQ